MSDPGIGAQDMVSPLRRVLVRRPGPALFNADPALWHYARPLNAAALTSQFDAFIHILESTGPEIHWLPEAGDGLADSIFSHDPSLMTRRGAVLMRMGKVLRRPEVELHAAAYESLGIPILGRIEAPGTVEAGDCLWLDEATLAVGRGVRTNQAGIDQLARILSPLGVAVHGFDLPLWAGEEACLHLMSIISLLDRDLALVYKPLLPVAFHRLLQERGIAMAEAPEDEFLGSAGLCINVLATAPRHGVMVAGYPKTRAAMEAAGATIEVFPGDELCLPCEGGPTCLTRPVLRG